VKAGLANYKWGKTDVKIQEEERKGKRGREQRTETEKNEKNLTP